ncbi:hypothetical protein PENSPDRAFT_686416 [Peniophora sp. CONT]|nr:hypothetical protein PENSPDRAFT_686416 [Peniophora sp. CONT]
MTTTVRSALTTIPMEILSKIVQEDTSECLETNRGRPIPMNIWNTINATPDTRLTTLPLCLSRVSPRKRIVSQQSEVCALHDGMAEPIIFPLSQVCRTLRDGLLADWTLWLGLLLLRPPWTALIVSRVPSDALFDFVKLSGLCDHVIDHVYDYLPRARKIDIVLPSWYASHPACSMGDHLAQKLIQASSLCHLNIRFDPGGEAEHTAYRVLVLPCLLTVTVHNSPVIFVGPQVRDLCLTTECTRDAQLHLDNLLYALANCCNLQYLHLENILYQDPHGLPWEWPAELRPGRLALPQLCRIIYGGSHMDCAALLYALDTKDGLDLHFDMGLSLGNTDSVTYNALFLSWPMLVFTRPSLAREIIDGAWLTYAHGNFTTQAVGPEDIPEDLPALEGDAGQIDAIAAEDAWWPRQLADPYWYKHEVCSCADLYKLSDFQEPGTAYSVIGIGVGSKSQTSSRTATTDTVTDATPDYVTLASGTMSDDIRECLSQQLSNDVRFLGPCRSLTIRNVPDMDDRFDSLAFAGAMKCLLRAYAKRCSVTDVKTLIIGPSSAQLPATIAWDSISCLSQLSDIHIEGRIRAGELLRLGQQLSLRPQNCPQLTRIWTRCVINLTNVGLADVTTLIGQLRRMTADRPNLHWEFMPDFS